ncbi:MAG: tryptophan--tRNA ligase [Bacteroidales bacterium]|jgi:tryptophanyl-tRNA synthetase|nr:tryptophan--tRNA ligase [Bacteroidales bacterium]
MAKVLSGIRPTGNLHLGNYLGAVKNFVEMQNTDDCLFFIADYHSLTTHQHPEELKKNVKNILVEYLACGLDPEKSIIYIQSDLPQLCEFYLLFNMIAYLGELERTASFKDKARKHSENVNAGLLTYPVLMAADILIHKADKVPVGKDQEQHLEMTRKFARRFNNQYGVEYFTEPVAYNFGKELIKIPGLDGSGKMGKSEGNCIYLIDNEKTIHSKVMKAVTDSGPVVPNSEMPEPIKNIFTILDIVSTQDTVSFFREKYNSCEIRYGDLKKQLAEDVIKVISPINQRIVELEKDDEYLGKIVKNGAEKAAETADKTIREIREIIGIRKFW